MQLHTYMYTLTLLNSDLNLFSQVACARSSTSLNYYDFFFCILPFLKFVSMVIHISTSSFQTKMKMRVNCINCWEVFKYWSPQRFPKVSYMYIVPRALFHSPLQLEICREVPTHQLIFCASYSPGYPFTCKSVLSFGSPKRSFSV